MNYDNAHANNITDDDDVNSDNDDDENNLFFGYQLQILLPYCKNQSLYCPNMYQFNIFISLVLFSQKGSATC